MKKIKLPAKLENLKRFLQFVSDYAEGKGFQKKTIQNIELATEEAIVNIVNYAYPKEKQGEIEIQCSVSANDVLTIEIIDSGVAFDVQAAPEPDVNAGISKREIGGLGIFLIRKAVDEMSYRRDSGHNILILTIHSSSEASSP